MKTTLKIAKNSGETNYTAQLRGTIPSSGLSRKRQRSVRDKSFLLSNYYLLEFVISASLNSFLQFLRHLLQNDSGVLWTSSRTCEMVAYPRLIASYTVPVQFILSLSKYQYQIFPPAGGCIQCLPHNYQNLQLAQVLII